MTSDHASARRCSASQFRNEYLASDRGNKGSTWIGTWFFLFFMKKIIILLSRSTSIFLRVIFNLEMIFFFFFLLY